MGSTKEKDAQEWILGPAIQVLERLVEHLTGLACLALLNKTNVDSKITNDNRSQHDVIRKRLQLLKMCVCVSQPKNASPASG